MPTSHGTSTRRRPLDRQRVLAAAIELADESGFGAVTMRSIADSLGVQPMSLYHHAAGKDEIVDGMVDAVFGEIELPSPGLEWRPALRARAVSMRAVLARHPWVTPLMPSRQNPGPHTLRHLDWEIGTLLRAGFSATDVAHAHSLLDSYIYGFVIQEAVTAFDDPETTPDRKDALRFIPSDTYPSLHEFATVQVHRADYGFANEFEHGLDLILDSLEHLLTGR